MRGNNSCTENLLETWSDPIVIKEVVYSPEMESMFIHFIMHASNYIYKSINTTRFNDIITDYLFSFAVQ